MLNDLFTSDTRAQIFRLLFDGKEHENYLRELERKSGKSIRSIQQEVKHLCEMDLILSRKDGNRIYFKANITHPLYPDLISIVEKTVGISSQLKKRLSDSRIQCAFIFGSIANNNEKAESDIDLIIIGELGMRPLSKLLSGLQEQFGREINPHIFSAKEFKNKIKNKDHFIKSILKNEIKEIIGNVDEYK